MKAKVIVRLKPEVHDPQGETIRRSLATLGYETVREVRQGKHFELTFDTASKEETLRLAEEIAQRVLASPVLETFEIEITD